MAFDTRTLDSGDADAGLRVRARDGRGGRQFQRAVACRGVAVLMTGEDGAYPVLIEKIKVLPAPLEWQRIVAVFFLWRVDEK